jgi:hypothetical protein
MKYSGVACLLAATYALAQSTADRTAEDAPTLVSKAGASSNLLRAFDNSFETVILRVSPAVIEGARTAPSRLHRVQARIIDLIPKHDCALVDGAVGCRNGYSDEGKTDRDCR